MIELPSSRDIPDQAAQYAYELRGKHRLGDRGIHDLFGFVETSLGYLLFRYPFGETAMQWFASPFHSHRLIATNSSMRLGREIFTLAHEIGHHMFDLDPDQNKMIGDNETGQFSTANLIEYRADWFAACFLMPEIGVKTTFRLLRENFSIDYRLILQLQREFSVSYTAMTRRLRDLSLINEEQRRSLNDYYNETNLNLHQLMTIYGGDTRLLEPAQVKHIPVNYLETLKTNYVNGWITYDVVVNTLGLVGLSPSNLGIEEKPEPSYEDDDDSIFDKIFTEYGE
ncbi:ImmA/IrrE family metallo-endopeptidase [Peribacillus frigoritolerans]|uniref:ImmA/IrrE family metallo-endopeptidase n=1 Tax=Peribacillus frigoritolerans TaxID=450367 RepID=UPI003CFDB64D